MPRSLICVPADRQAAHELPLSRVRAQCPARGALRARFERFVWMLVLMLGLGQGGVSAAPALAVGAEETVAIGVLDAFAPFYRWNETLAAPEGFDVELMAEVARTTGRRFTWRRYGSFPALLDALRRGEVRLITATGQTAQRAVHLRFTRPYAAVQQAFIGRDSITSVPATPDLSGRRLAVVSGFVSESIAAERFPTASRPVYTTLAQAVDAVARGDADFVLEALPALRPLMQARPAARLTVLRTYGFPEGHLRLAAGLADGDLIRQLDIALAGAEQGALPALRTKWLPPEPKPAAEPRNLAAAAPLRIGYLPMDHPFTVRQADGQADGIAIRMMRRVAERAAIPIAAFEPVLLADGLRALREGRLDVMLGLTETADRREAMAFVGPYRVNPLVIVGRRQYAVWDLHQLANKRMAMVQGYFALEYVRQAHPLIEIVNCARAEDCLRMIEDGRADAALYGLQGSYERLGARAAGALQITGTVPGLYDEHNLGLSLARQDLAPRLRDALNGVLVEELAGIEANWAAEEARSRVDWSRVWRVAAAAGLALGLMATAIVVHLRRVRREMRRTEAARQESEQYVAFMAHEVRNALQSVGGAVTLLRGAPTATDLQRPLLDALGRSARSTLGLLDALLDRHRLHAGQFAVELRPESLERVLRAVMDEVASMAETKGLQLVFERLKPLPGRWRIDALRLQQIVRNLLVNAIKFSDRGSVCLAVSIEPEGAGRHTVCVDITDQGPGMSEAQQSLAFAGFHTSGGDRPGSGLGLRLCRDLARALGGTLTVSSQPGAGARFQLRFPAEAAAEVDESPGNGVRRVLVVEDSLVYGLLLQQAFQNQGVEATLAPSLAAARDALGATAVGARPYDLVLTDAQLGDGHALDLLGACSSLTQADGVPIPVLVMSADVDESMRVKLAARGAQELLAKDADVAQFVTRVLSAAGAVRRPANGEPGRED